MGLGGCLVGFRRRLPSLSFPSGPRLSGGRQINPSLFFFFGLWMDFCLIERGGSFVSLQLHKNDDGCVWKYPYVFI